MTWNWQQADWPNFSWDASRLRMAEEEFLRGSGLFLGSIRHLPESDRAELAVQAMSAEAVTTSEIEGDILDRASVQSSIRRQFGLAADRRRVRPAEEGIAEMMIELYRTFSEPLSEPMLFRWHRTLFRGRKDLKSVGRYRADREPMQVVSGALYELKVHFEAPPSARVPKEMARFVRWFHASAPGGAKPLPALTRAAIAHLYFECIHPFEDGNGRIGRAISEKALAQAAQQPTPIALAQTILAHRKRYYAALEASNKENEITRWIRWFAGIAIEAQRRTTAGVEFLIDKTRLLDRLRGELNERQEKALLRMLAEGPEGFQGGLSAGNYARITGATTATTTRDLADMAAKGALIRRGERRYARYYLSIPLRPTPAVMVDEKGAVV
jgi:Fic family protein